MQEKSIVKISELINGQRDHEIELRPQPYAHNGDWVWPIATRQHQENHADNDADAWLKLTNRQSGKP